MRVGKLTSYICALFLILIVSPPEKLSFGQSTGRPSAPSSSACLSLEDVVASAINASESLKIQRSDAVVAAEQYAEAKAAVMPNVKASATISKQDESQAKAKQEDYPTLAKVSVTQPIYGGGAEYAALRKTSQQAEAGAKAADGARIKVARDAVSKSYQVLAAQSELKSSAELRDLSRRRFKDIRSRVAIGRSKASDGLGAEAQVANSDAQYEAARLAFESTKRQLSSLIGKNVQAVCDVSSKATSRKRSWDDVLKKLMQRPDILAADLTAMAASENVAMARAGHNPSLEVGGNYYFKRPEVQRQYGKWDVTLSAALPIYSGGMVSSKVNEAVALEQKQIATFRQLKQSAEDEAREIWEVFSAGSAQLKSLEEAAKKSAQYYQVVANDERKGLATSLETLQALNASIDAQRAAEKAKIKFEETARQLDLVSGDVEGALR